MRVKTCGNEATGGVRLIWKPADFGWFNSILWEKTSRIKPGQDKRTGPWPALVVPFCLQSLEHDGSGVMLFRRQSPGGAHNSCFSALAEENNFALFFLLTYMLAMFWASVVWISNGNILCTFYAALLPLFSLPSGFALSLEAGANVCPGKELKHQATFSTTSVLKYKYLLTSTDHI